MKFTGFDSKPGELAKLNSCIKDILAKIFENRDKLPKEKIKKLSELIFSDAEVFYGGAHCRRGLAGYTYPATKKIHICPRSFGEEPGRLCSILFHELVHATGEGEFDAEVIENIVYPPAKNDSGNNISGTWPYKDCSDFCRDTRVRSSDGLRETDHFIWNPTTGEVWHRKSDGSKGDHVFARDKWKHWKCPPCPRISKEMIAGEPFIDGFEPGDGNFTEPSSQHEQEKPENAKPGSIHKEKIEKLIHLLQEILNTLKEKCDGTENNEESSGSDCDEEGCIPYPHESGGNVPEEGEEGFTPYPHEEGGLPHAEGGSPTVFFDPAEPNDKK